MKNVPLPVLDTHFFKRVLASARPSVLAAAVVLLAHVATADLTPGWVRTLGGAAFSSPALAPDGTVIIGTRDNSVRAYSPEGVALWAFQAGDWVDATPAVGPDGTVYAGSWDGYVYAIDRDGTLQWTFETGSAVIASPLLVGDLLVIASLDGFAYGIDSASGLERWAYLVNSPVRAAPVTDTLGTGFIADAANRVHAVNLATGVARWVTNLANLPPLLKPTPLRRVSGNLAFSQDGLLLVPSSDGVLYALDESGALGWHFAATAELDSQPVVDAEGDVTIACRNGLIYHLDRSGFLDWSAQIGVVFYSTPAIGRDGSIYAIGYAGSGSTRLYQIDLTGFELLSTVIPADNEASILLTPDGYLYAAYFDGTLHQFDTQEPPVESPWPQFRQTPQRNAGYPSYYRPFHQWCLDHLGPDALRHYHARSDPDGDSRTLLYEFTTDLSPARPDRSPVTVRDIGEGPAAWELSVWVNRHALDVDVRVAQAAALDDLPTAPLTIALRGPTSGVLQQRYAQPLTTDNPTIRFARFHFSLY